MMGGEIPCVMSCIFRLCHRFDARGSLNGFGKGRGRKEGVRPPGECHCITSLSHLLTVRQKDRGFLCTQNWFGRRDSGRISAGKRMLRPCTDPSSTCTQHKTTLEMQSPTVFFPQTLKSSVQQRESFKDPLICLSRYFRWSRIGLPEFGRLRRVHNGRFLFVSRFTEGPRF